jgi:hypothetical protein
MAKLAKISIFSTANGANMCRLQKLKYFASELFTPLMSYYIYKNPDVPLRRDPVTHLNRITRKRDKPPI